MEQANSHPFDLAILDLYLSDGSTLELATKITHVCPGARILLLSGLEIEESTAQSAQAAGFTLEHKPFGANALAEFLRSLEAGTLTLATASPAHAPSPAIAPQQVFEPDIERKIDELIAMTRANGAVLFGEDEEKAGEVNWLHPVNVEIDARGETRSTLLYSPVGDVIRDQRSVVIRDVIEEAARAKYLLRAIHFRSCLGIPVRVPFYHRPYALFFFSDRADTFSEQTASFKSAVDELGVLMFRQSVFSRLVLAHRELLRSQLRAGALHDVRNTLGSMDFYLARS
jgi:CheY-like chemotaxis protein